MTAERAVTSTVEFVLTIAIAATLVSGLIIAASSMVDRQNTAVGRSQMEVVGQQVAGAVESAGRLDRSAETSELELEYDLPERILSTGYSIEVTGTEVVVTASVSEHPVTVPCACGDVTPTTVDGGDIAVRYDSASDTLEVVHV